VGNVAHFRNRRQYHVFLGGPSCLTSCLLPRNSPSSWGYPYGRFTAGHTIQPVRSRFASAGISGGGPPTCLPGWIGKLRRLRVSSADMRLNTMELSELGAAALAYSRRGWPVFPVEPRGKKPIGSLVPHGLKDASTDSTVISHWWSEYPNANIGLPTGIAFDVIDVDGPQALANVVEAQSGREMTTGPEVATGRGWHLYHRPTGLGNKAGLLPGVDYRGRGGYVIAPPSIHPNGYVYRWAVYNRPDGIIEGADEPLTEVPTWFRVLLVGTPQPFPRPAVPTTPLVRGAAYARRALDAELGRIASAPEGQRNEQLNRSAYALGQLVAAGTLDPHAVADALVLVATRAGLAEAEARSTIASGLRAGLQKHRVVA